MKTIKTIIIAAFIAIAPAAAYACVTCPGYCANGYHWENHNGTSYAVCD